MPVCVCVSMSVCVCLCVCMCVVCMCVGVCVVHKMKVSRDLLEAVTGYLGGYEAVSQLVIGRPIVSNFWEMVDTHDDVKPMYALSSSMLACHVVWAFAAAKH